MTPVNRGERAIHAALTVVQVAAIGCAAWFGWHHIQAAHADACALPATAFEVAKQLVCGGDARDLAVLMFGVAAPLFALFLVAAVAAGLNRGHAKRD